MRHRKVGRTLGRSPSHQLALKRNLARALFEYERIVTTLPKAKEVRPFVERLITLAKKASAVKDTNEPQALHYRKMAMQRLPDADAVQKLFEEIGPRYHDRSGGYTRILKRHKRRLGDGGETAFLELLQEGEEKVTRSREEEAVAPMLAPTPPEKVEEEVEQTPPAEESLAEESPVEENGESKADAEEPKAEVSGGNAAGQTAESGEEQKSADEDTEEKKT